MKLNDRFDLLTLEKMTQNLQMRLDFIITDRDRLMFASGFIDCADLKLPKARKRIKSEATEYIFKSCEQWSKKQKS